MGKIYIATCFKCGYKTGLLYFGGGITDFTVYNGEPVYNFETKEIEVANGKERGKIQKENPNLGFLFNNDKLYKKHQCYTIDFGDDIGEKEFKDRKLYLCPKCNEYGIDFLWQGMWD